MVGGNEVYQQQTSWPMVLEHSDVVVLWSANPLNTLKTVSYTHLDVYKRQIAALLMVVSLSGCFDKEGDQRKAFIDFLQNTAMRSGCLLYTSSLRCWAMRRFLPPCLALNRVKGWPTISIC